jgi:flagellin
MTLSINTNIASVQAARALAANRDNMETTMQRLSTGKRINSTLDDASGLAVANRMRNQIAGLNMAIRNANDGISLAQTAEGSMEALQNVLLRMRELATQASNGTYTADDRSYMAAEFDELMREIRRVSNHAAWDGDVKLIAEGSKPHQFQVGIDSADYIQVPLRSLAVEDLNLSNKATLTSSKGSAVEAFKFHDLSTLSKPAVTFAPADWGGTDKSELTDVRFIDNPRPNFELRLWNGSRDSDGNPEGLASSVNILSVTGAGSVQDLITQLKAHPNYDSTVADITFSNGEMRVIWKVAGQPDPASQLVVTNPVDRGNAVAIPAGTSSVNHGADLVESVASDPINYPAHYQQEFNLSKVVFHRDTVPKSAGNFFAIQIGSRTLTADNVANAADLAAKFKQDSDYSFIREKIGLGSSKLELFEVIDVPAGKANVSGSAITQLEAQAATDDLYTSSNGKNYLVKQSSGPGKYAGNVSGNPISQTRAAAVAAAAVGDIYLDGSTYKIYNGSSADTTLTAAAPTSVETDLLTAALASARVQKLKINFGKDSTERGFMYQSTHNVTISDPESAVSALDFVDAATRTVSESRSRMGAVMSGIEFTINNLMNVVENTEEAKSRVLDTDYAKESAELAKAQILAQAGTAMLAQANQSQQYVLNLLRQG